MGNNSCETNTIIPFLAYRQLIKQIISWEPVIIAWLSVGLRGTV